MDKNQAYEYFLAALKKKLLVVVHELDSTPVETSKYSELIQEQIRVQELLIALDNIANAV